MFLVRCRTELIKSEVLPIQKLSERLRILMSRAKKHEIMFEKQSPKIDAVCVLLLALFLVGLAGYSVIIQFLR